MGRHCYITMINTTMMGITMIQMCYTKVLYTHMLLSYMPKSGKRRLESMDGITEAEVIGIAKEYYTQVRETIRMRNDLKEVLVREKANCNNVESESTLKAMEKTLVIPGLSEDAIDAIRASIDTKRANLAKNGEKGRDMFKNRNALLKCCEKEQLEAIEKMLDVFLHPRDE